mgnify:CR=1 FL=1
MISAIQLLYNLDLRLNKVASLASQQIQPEDKLIILNQAQIRLIKLKVGQNNIYKIGFDGFTKRYQDLQFLVENFEDHPIDLKLSDKHTNKYIADISTLTPKFMFYVDSYMIADKEECKDRILYCNKDLVKHSDINTLLQNDNYKPSFEYQETICDISSDEIHYYTDGTFTPKKVYLSYIRYPKEIDISGYIKLDGSNSTNQDCELEDYLEEELLDLAVQSLSMITDNEKSVQYTQQKLLNNE